MEKLSAHNQAHVAEIVPHLFLGSYMATKRIILKTLDIHCVISVGADVYSPFLPGVEYHRFDFRDTAEDTPLFLALLPEALSLMDEQISRGRNVLIHCSAGKSRSVSIVLQYLMQHGGGLNGLNGLDATLAHVKSKRECINPNPAFLAG